jgi:hypothetical protein
MPKQQASGHEPLSHEVKKKRLDVEVVVVVGNISIYIAVLINNNFISTGDI